MPLAQLAPLLGTSVEAARWQEAWEARRSRMVTVAISVIILSASQIHCMVAFACLSRGRDAEALVMRPAWAFLPRTLTRAWRTIWDAGCLPLDGSVPHSWTPTPHGKTRRPPHAKRPPFRGGLLSTWRGRYSAFGASMPRSPSGDPAVSWASPGRATTASPRATPSPSAAGAMLLCGRTPHTTRWDMP